MYLFKKQIWLTVGLLLTLVACGGGETATTTQVDIFDGAALGCKVSSNGIIATELGSGVYTFNPALPEGAVATASGCTDSDTQSLLPELLGAVQSGAMVISPITQLIVEAAIAKTVAAGGQDSELRAGVITISTTELTAATDRIVTNLRLGDYQPINPKTANYIVAAKADSTGSSAAAVAMRASLAISTLLKSVEVSAGVGSARLAVSAVSQAIATSSTVVDLAQRTAIEAVMTTAKEMTPAVATSIQAASDAIATIVAIISGATGDIANAIAATTTVSEFLNTATETTITDSAVIVQLTTDTETAIAASIAKPACTIGSTTLGGCKL